MCNMLYSGVKMDDIENDYSDFTKDKIEMTKESKELVNIIRKNLAEIFERDVSIAETINMLVAMGIESWTKMKQDEEAEDLV